MSKNDLKKMKHKSYLIDIKTEYKKNNMKVLEYTLKGKSREQSLVIARQIAMFILREDSQMNLTTIGLLFGGRDHTTVLHGIRKIQTDAATNQNLRRDLLAIRSSVINN